MMQTTFLEGESLEEKITRACEVLRFYERCALESNQAGYHGCFSGGKDSVVIKSLAAEAGVRCTWNFNVTTIDPPEIYRYIRKHHPDVRWHHQPKHFFRVMVEERGFPMRRQRWCCQVFKEGGGAGSVMITGVRWAESPRRRKQWKQFQRWDATKSHGKSADSSWMVNPIVDWRDDDVWEFIRHRNLSYCELYDHGHKRLGCVGCPMAGVGRQRDFAKWPVYEKAWRRAFQRLWARRYGTLMTKGKSIGEPWPGIPGIETWEQLFEWWLSEKAPPKEDSCQLGFW